MHDDTESFLAAFKYASHHNAILVLGSNKKYLIKRKLYITASIQGNGSTILPAVEGLDLMRILKDDVVISNLTIDSGTYRNIRVESDRVKIIGCNINSSKGPFTILIHGDFLTIVNSTITNHYKKTRNIALFSKKPIVGLSVRGCTIVGGVYLANTTFGFAGNHRFEDNTFEVDFTHAPQTFAAGQDAFSFHGIKNVHFLENKIRLTNVNRAFKISDIHGNPNPDLTTQYTSDSITFQKCDITSSSINGKQLFDLHRGSGSLRLDSCTITASGHTVIFENKTEQVLSVPSSLEVKNSVINFDFRLLYFRCTPNVKSKRTSVSFLNNEFILLPAKKIKSLQRSGQAKIIKNNYLFGVHNLLCFQLTRNTLTTSTVHSGLEQSTFAYISNVGNATINSNRLLGSVLIKNNEPINTFVFTENTVKKARNKETIEFTAESKKPIMSMNNNKTIIINQ